MERQVKHDTVPGKKLRGAGLSVEQAVLPVKRRNRFAAPVSGVDGLQEGAAAVRHYLLV